MDIKDEFYEWLCILMPSLLRAENMFIKSIWFIIFVCMTTISTYLLSADLKEYFEYNVNTNIKIISESQSEFPIVSICNLNPFKTTNKTILMQLENVLKENNITDLINERRTPILHRTISRLLKNHVFNITDKSLQNEFGYNDKELITKCFYNKNICFGNESYLINILWFYSYEYGNCYRLNSLHKTGKNGETGGFNLELYAGNSSLPFTDYYMNSRGFRLLIHNKSDLDLNLKDYGIDISTGRVTNIAIKRTFHQRLPKPHSDCVENLDLNSLDDSLKTEAMKTMQYKFHYEKYSKIQCENIIYQDRLFENCSCIDPSYLCEPDHEFKMCSSLDDIFCYEQFYFRFYSNRESFVGNQCPEGNYF